LCSGFLRAFVPLRQTGFKGEILIAAIPMEHGLILAAILFALGLTGVLIRRNIVFMLMSV
jgi:hypothetical protein